MKTLLNVNLSTKSAQTGTAAWVPPPFSFGESLTLAFRFAETVGGQAVEPTLDITALTAGIGYVDARPQSGEWALQIGDGAQTVANTTAALQHDCSPAALAAAINLLSAVVGAYGAAVARKAEGSWMITFATAAAAVPLTVRDNSLFPVCLGRVTAAELDGVWIHEVRLLQVPGAFTSTSARVLPDAPTITRVREGGTADGYSWNEIQALYVPPDFRGTYSLKKGFARTGQLSVSDAADTILTALEDALGANFTVTNPAPYTAHIEFTGDYEGTALALLEVLPLNPPPGDLTCTLELDRAPLLVWLRTAAQVTLPLEVRIRTLDADAVERWQVAFRQDITIRRPLVFPELEETPTTDWLRPMSPKSYVPFNPETVITGHQFFRAVAGDGTATEFAVAHGLDTDEVFLFVRENVAGGRQLVDGTDFSAVFDNANAATVTALTGAPALNAWAVTLVSAQTVSAFAEDLMITIGQVTGLDDRFTALETAVGEVLALIPTTPIGTASTAGATASITIAIPDYSEAFPARFAAGLTDIAKARPGGLIPAIHDASVTSITVALPSVAGASGNVYQNNSGGALLVPGGLGTRGSSLAVGEYAGSDGRRLYPLSRAGATNSYFPRDFERELFMIEVNAQMLRAGTTLTLGFELSLQLLQATSRAQYVVVLEHGTAPTQTDPATTANNLQDIVWNATPLLSQRVILGPAKMVHKFGAEILRAANGVLAANKSLYNFRTAADDVPDSADVALRARLINFDTENSVSYAKGIVSIALSAASATIK